VPRLLARGVVAVAARGVAERPVLLAGAELLGEVLSLGLGAVEEQLDALVLVLGVVLGLGAIAVGRRSVAGARAMDRVGVRAHLRRDPRARLDLGGVVGPADPQCPQRELGRRLPTTHLLHVRELVEEKLAVGGRVRQHDEVANDERARAERLAGELGGRSGERLDEVERRPELLLELGLERQADAPALATRMLDQRRRIVAGLAGDADALLERPGERLGLALVMIAGLRDPAPGHCIPTVPRFAVPGRPRLRRVAPGFARSGQRGAA